MALEMLRGHPSFKASEPEEDKRVFQRKSVPANYLTKCDTVYFTMLQLRSFMLRNKHVYIVWTIRDPRDMAMSKLRRGVPAAEGGDCKGYARDGNPKGCVEDIGDMRSKYAHVMGTFADRATLVRMEGMLESPKASAQEMCSFLGLKYAPGMERFWTRMRNNKKRARYKGRDMSQIAMHRNWQTAYGGWLVEKKFDMPALFKRLQNTTRFFCYPVA